MKLIPKSPRASLCATTASLLILAGCEDFEGFQGFTDTPLANDNSIDIIERDIEKPEIFTQRDMGLWDGRPSFGGVWVALPGNVQPERVSITNVDNGKTVVGALFKREEQNPGPPIRLSSDAASALEVIPGNPTLLSVTVVRRETFASVPNTPSDAIPADVETATLEPLAGAAQDTPQDTPSDAQALADELTATLEGDAPQVEEATTGAAEVAAGAATATAAAAADAAQDAAPAAAPRERRGLLDLFTRRPNREAPQGEVISVITPQGEVAPVAGADTAPQAETTTIETTAIETAVAPPTPATTSALETPFLQTGTFSTRANAEAQVRQLDGAGIPALIRERVTDEGKSLFRVLAGPAASPDQQGSFATAVRGLGITDAFATAN